MFLAEESCGLVEEAPHRHWQRREEHAEFPGVVTIGRDESVAYRTAALKEYPSSLCKALAGALTDRFDHLLSRKELRLIPDLPSSISCWVNEVADESSTVRHNSTWRPDYQGS